jgi:dTMP kinase
VSVTLTILQRFIVLEGLDGSGTSTQLQMLAERLGREGTAHCATWEPTDGPVGALLRSVLARDTKAHPRTIAMLYAADRNEHVFSPQTGIEARTRRGELVISDRYLFSSLAYQSIENGFDFVEVLNSAFPLPQCVIFLDTPVAVCQERLAGRGKVELYDSHAFQVRVRESYIRTLEYYRGRGLTVFVVNGDRPAGIIHGEIWNLLAHLPISRS